jgi:NTE family protein
MSEPAVGPEAVVLSGGGAKGAYEVGVLSALAAGASPATNRPIAPVIFSGTSVGSYNATFLATQTGDFATRVARLVATWHDRIANGDDHCGNGVYRIRGLPFQGLSRGCFSHPLQALTELAHDGVVLTQAAVNRGIAIARSQLPPLARLAETFDLTAIFSSSPLQQLVQETLDPRRLIGGLELRVVATNWQAGGSAVFTGTDIAGAVGTDAVLASAAIPGIFTPVVIAGIPYVDGGVEATTPIGPALAAGARLLHVIYLDPHLSAIPLPAVPDTFETIYRLYALLVSSNFNRVLSALSRAARPLGEPPLVIHRYRPGNDLGGLAGLVDFRLNAIEGLIAQGYADAVAHDCRASQCLGVSADNGSS